MKFRQRAVVFLVVLLTAIFNITSLVEAQPATPGPEGGAKKICDSAGAAAQTCRDCMGTGDEVEGVWTAIGCISTQPAAAAQQIFNLALGVGGVFILVQILLGAFGLITSSGNPAAVEKAKKQITDSVIALLFLVFSIALLQLIGMEILMLPGMAT